MRRALEVARQTPAGDIPVGAVLYDAAGNELSIGVNRREQRGGIAAKAFTTDPSLLSCCA